MRALVTGGAGFIGSNLVDALLGRGGEVLVVDDLSTGRRENLEPALRAGAELVVADVCDSPRVKELGREFRPEGVFHLAAQIDVRRSVADPTFDARVNVLGTGTMLEVAREAGARLINVSTGGAIYGEGAGRRLPLSEDAEVAPEAPYGQSKLAAEGYVDLYRRTRGLRAASLRLGNVYGPRQDPLGEAGVIAIFCGRLVSGARPTVFGDGRQTRDYIYVGDVVDALLAAEERLARSPDALGPVYNIGTGLETSVLELVERFVRLGGRDDFQAELAPAREGEVRRIAIDSSRAAADLDWQSRVELDRGLELTLDSV